MNIKCPKCTTVLSLAAPPAGGKVKCPKCATILGVGGAPKPTASAPVPAAAPSAANPPGQPSPHHPAPAQSGSGAFPSAASVAGVSGSIAEGANAPVRQFYQPTAATPYVPPATASPKPEVLDPSSGKPAAKKSDGSDYEMSMAGKVALAGGVGSLVFLLLAIIIGMLVFGGGGSDELASTTPVEPSFEVPPGFTEFTTAGVSIAMPSGDELTPYLGGMTSKAIRTPMNTVFYMGASSGDKVRTTDDSIKKLAGRYLGGGVILAGTCSRNGYEGRKAIMDGSLYYPDLSIEIYQVDGRFVILGVTREGGGGGNYVLGQVSEPELQAVFFDSFTVGPETRSFW